MQLYQTKTWLHYLDAFTQLTFHRSQLLLKGETTIIMISSKKVKRQQATCNNQVTNDKQRQFQKFRVKFKKTFELNLNNKKIQLQ